MSIPVIIFIALGLSMDCFAVSVASGFAIKQLKIRHALRMAFFFGSFQALMPIIGWFAGTSIRSIISGFDHWIAFGLLTAIGGKMIYEATVLEKDEKEEIVEMGLHTLLLLSVATSIDALAVGISLSVLKVAIITPALIIGLTAFLISLAGVGIGKSFGHFFEKKIEIAGGLILIGIGIKILIEHLR